VIAAAVLLLAQAAEPADPCDADPQTKQQMYQCSVQEFDRADADLKKQWELTAGRMLQLDKEDNGLKVEPGYHETAVAAQNAWLAYRDAECVAESAVAGRPSGRSIEVTLELQCKTELTQMRIDALRGLVAE
jgi:uncharacterized protein YecT (DUF1311 family)